MTLAALIRQAVRLADRGTFSLHEYPHPNGLRWRWNAACLYRGIHTHWYAATPSSCVSRLIKGMRGVRNLKKRGAK
jgi:hypothetical protein